jgi:hypothetical protein
MRFPIAILATTVVLALGAGPIASAISYGASTYAGSTLVGHYALGDPVNYQPAAPDCLTANEPRDLNDPTHFGENGFSYSCNGVNYIDLPTSAPRYAMVSYTKATGLVGTEVPCGSVEGVDYVNPAYPAHAYACSYNPDLTAGAYHADFNCLLGCDTWQIVGAEFAVCFYDASGAQIQCDTGDGSVGYGSFACGDDTGAWMIEGYMPYGTTNVIFTSSLGAKVSTILYGQDVYSSCNY